jgi:hypothetical protein
MRSGGQGYGEVDPSFTKATQGFFDEPDQRPASFLATALWCTFAAKHQACATNLSKSALTRDCNNNMAHTHIFIRTRLWWSLPFCASFFGNLVDVTRVCDFPWHWSCCGVVPFWTSAFGLCFCVAYSYG